MDREARYELIERYLLNKAEPNERIQLEQLMASDPLVAEEVKEHQKLIDLMHEHAKLEGLRQTIQAQRVYTRPHAYLTREFPMRKVLAVAAGLALLVVAGWWFLVRSGGDVRKAEKERSQLLATRYQEPIWPLERGEHHVISQAVQLHLGGRTDEALTLLSQQEPASLEHRTWATEIMVHAGRYKDARPLLEALSIENPQNDRIATLLQVCNSMLDKDN